jgi:hypothetical protein
MARRLTFTERHKEAFSTRGERGKGSATVTA